MTGNPPNQPSIRNPATSSTRSNTIIKTGGSPAGTFVVGRGGRCWPGRVGFYGGNGIWQMDKPGDLMQSTHFSHFWYDGLSHEGTGQMQHVRTLIETLGVNQLVPDSTRLRSSPGTVDNRVQVACGKNDKFLVAYITDGHPITLDLSGLSGKRLAGY